MNTLRAGAAQVDITPDLGHNLAGWIDVRPATRRASPIVARALALVAGSTSALIIACDVLEMGAELARRIEETIETQCSIPPQSLFILPSHNHYGPSVSGSYANSAERTSHEMAYTAELVGKLAAAAQAALEDLRPARVRVGYGAERTYLQNSRFWRTDGAINWVGHRDELFAEESGPFDPQVGLLCLTDEAGKAIATLFNVACHANAAEEDGFSTISWDWPGYAAQTIERAMGGEALFLVGACGNVHPVREGIARPMGKEIGRIVIAAAQGSRTIVPTPLAVWQQEIKIPARDFDAFDPRQIEMICSQLWDQATRSQVQGIFMHVLEDLRDRKPHQFVTRLRVLVLGEVAVLFVPGEYFTEFGLEIKRRAPFADIFVVESLGESVGYVPTRRAYDEGGYQTAVGARVAPGSGELIMEKSLALLDAIRQGADGSVPFGE